MKYLNNAIRLALCLTVLLVAGCGVDSWHIDRAKSFCDDKGGVDRIYAFMDRVVTCDNGETKNINGN